MSEEISQPPAEAPQLVPVNLTHTCMGRFKSAWVWVNGQMTDQAQCLSCGNIWTPSTMKEDKSQ